MKKIINIFLVLFIFAGLTIFSLVIAENPGAGDQGQDTPQTQDQQGGQQLIACNGFSLPGRIDPSV